MTVNEAFKDFPIDYFTFKNEDFNSENQEFEFSAEQLVVENGYIGNSLYEKIDFERRETTIVNCAVGQGKTSAILNSIKEYLGTEESYETYFVIAVPLVSLVTQYKKDLLELGFEEEQIFSYENISDEIPESGETYINYNCKIHIVTVNTLLGNAGENAIIQSNRKYSYIRTFAEELSTHGKRLIIIYDEIHEAVRNFTETGMTHLGHFSSVLWKNILLSATYNVQSIPVIKLLSKQTKKKIRLLESERLVTKSQSQLFLHFDNEYGVKKYTGIKDLLINLANEGKQIDVLCYSKKLCKSLLKANDEPGRTLTSKFGRLRDCTSAIENNQGDHDEDLSKNRFDNQYCNIGTNFKSGVNITKENHAYVIVLPPASSRGTYANFNGIFSEGPNAVIQALARQRTPGEIHVFLPKPILMDFETLPSMTALQKEIFIEWYQNVAMPTQDIETTGGVEVKKTRYIPFAQHLDEVKKWWKIVQSRREMPTVLNSDLPAVSFDNFVLENGEKCTSSVNFGDIDHPVSI